MILYIESNFLLEIARQQEDAVSAEELLRLAETGKISLAFPSIAVTEPFSTLTYYGNQRAKFADTMREQLRELSRSLPHQSLATLHEPLGPTLVRITRDELSRLEEVAERLLLIGRSLPLSHGLFRKVREIELGFGLSAQDAIVYASIASDVAILDQAEPKCFVSTNFKDFDNPKLLEPLKAANCRYIVRFSQALSFIKNDVGSA